MLRLQTQKVAKFAQEAPEEEINNVLWNMPPKLRQTIFELGCRTLSCCLRLTETYDKELYLILKEGITKTMVQIKKIKKEECIKSNELSLNILCKGWLKCFFIHL